MSEQKSIADITHQFESHYVRKFDHLAELKQSILQKAFSGELEQGATVRKFRIVRTEGSRQVARRIEH